MNLRRILGFAALLCLLASASSLRAVIITNVVPPLSPVGTHEVNIYGNGFTASPVTTLKVEIGNVVMTTNPSSVVSDTRIQLFNVPVGASSDFIYVTINGGTRKQSPQQFIIINTNAYVTNFTPTYGDVDSTVTLTGVQFITGGATNVMFNGVVSKKTALTPVVNNDNTMTVTVPGGVTTGPITVMSKFGVSHNFSTVSNQLSSATNFYAQATLNSFSPTNGRPSTNVVLTGTNFTAISGILFGSVTASDFTISNNTSIRVAVPAGASTGKITVSPPAGTFLSPALSTLNFRILPTILSVSPTSGPVGTVVTLTGSGLNEQSPAPIVTVGGGVVTSFGTVSPGTLSFTVPATAASGYITITTTNGTTSSPEIFYLPASITSFTPTNGAAGTLVTLTGKNFTNTTVVSFNGVPATTFVVTNNTTIGAIAPASVTSGTISITTPFGTTNTTALFYVAPTIIDFTPNHGLPGARIMITGTSFTNASAVLFNGIPATSFTVTNNTTLSAVVPSGATTGKISVTAPGGTGQSATDFTIDTADIGVSVTALPDPVFVGSNLVYTIIVTNTSPTAALNVRLTNTLAPSVLLKSASISQGTLVTNTIPITGALGSLNGQSAATILLTVNPTVAGIITNKTIVGTDSLDGNTANNLVFTTTTVWPLPVLSITDLMSNNLVQIKWPAALSNFTLQYRSDLSATNFWSNDTTLKVINGGNVTVIDTNVGTAKFFRLTN